MSDNTAAVFESPFTTPTGDVLVRAWDRNTRKPLSGDELISQFRHQSRMLDPQFEEVDGHQFLALADNLVVNKGRQTIANLIGGRDYDSSVPNSDWMVKFVRFGTYDSAPKFSDLTLSPQPQTGLYTGGENTIPLDAVSGVPSNAKLISAVDWPQDFLVRFEIELGPDEANGYLVREMGLFTGNDNLFARKTFVGLSKSAAFGLTFLWRVRC